QAIGPRARISSYRSNGSRSAVPTMLGSAVLGSVAVTYVLPTSRAGVSHNPWATWIRDPRSVERDELDARQRADRRPGQLVAPRSVVRATHHPELARTARAHSSLDGGGSVLRPGEAAAAGDLLGQIRRAHLRFDAAGAHRRQPDAISFERRRPRSN